MPINEMLISGLVVACGIMFVLTVQMRLTEQRLRESVAELSEKVRRLENTNCALEEALAIVQRELGDARAALQYERGQRIALSEEVSRLRIALSEKK